MDFLRCCAATCVVAVIFLSAASDAATELQMVQAQNEPVLGGQIRIGCTVTEAQMGMLLFWYKADENGDEVQLATNQVLNTEFRDTERYHMEMTQEGTSFAVTLTIENAQIEDSGRFACEVLNNGTPLDRKDSIFYIIAAPVEEVHMYSLDASDIQGTAIKEYQHGDKLEIEEGEQYFFRCTAEGGNPAPDMDITLGDMNVTNYFTPSRSQEDLGGNPGLKLVRHKLVMTSSIPITVTNEMNAYEFKCAARSVNSDVKSISIEPVMSFSPLLDCPSKVKASMYSSLVDVTCTVKSNPSLLSMSASWEIGSDPENRENETITLTNPEDGHYKVSLKPGDASDEKRITLHMDKIYPQMFRKYYIGATNSLGTTYTVIELVDDDTVAPGYGGSTLVRTSIVLTISALLSAKLV